MELFSIRFTSTLLLLCTFWSVTDCTTTTPSLTTDVTTGVSTVTTQQPTTPPLPEDVKNVDVVGRTENSIIIEFDKVKDISEYRWYYGIQEPLENRTFTDRVDSRIKLTLDNLTSAQNYIMILRSVSGGRESNGTSFFGITAPKNVPSFKVRDQNASSITLEWTKLELGDFQYSLEYNGNNQTFTADDPTMYVVPNLDSNKYYNFTLYTVFEEVKSTGFNLTAATAPSPAEGFKNVSETVENITLQWKNEPKDIRDVLIYKLTYNKTERNFTASKFGDFVEYIATGLESATNYTFSLVTIFDNIPGDEVFIIAPTAPRKTENFRVVTQNETSITLRWDPNPDTTEYLLQFDDKNTPIIGRNEETITNLTSTTLYNFTLFAVFAGVKSSGFPLTAPTAPRNTGNFTSVAQTETWITLRWEPVPGVTQFVLNSHRGNLTLINEYEETASGLERGVAYNFTLFAVFEGAESSGVHLTAATVPPQVTSVKVTGRTLTSITLQWEKGREDWKYSVEFNENLTSVQQSGRIVSCTVSSLKEGTLYDYGITTLFYNLRSTTYKEQIVTPMDCTRVSWTATETSIYGRLDGRFSSAVASNGTEPQSSSVIPPNINFTRLYPGATYTVTLKYDEWEQCEQPIKPITTIPPALKAKCKNSNGGYSIYVEWDSPSGVWDTVEVNVSGQVHKETDQEKNYIKIGNFQPAQKYKVSIGSQSREQRSRAYVFTCPTDARGVIAGAFFGVLLFLILACVIVFVLLRKPDIIRRNKPHLGGAKTPSIRSKAIPLEKFPAHFSALSADEYKALSIEYEDLGPVGTDQSQKAATTPENKPKNRFVNVLPYDRSRVRLTSTSPHNDYINASYMPGYNSDREFIAAQGPMPSTASDFWRMIWEQKAKGIVMVTNCVEGGRTKCEQYWPDSGPRVCGDLAVFKTSETKESDWTLREFSVKNRRTSEERTVKHFHFTAWPDHGVPEGTEVLIRFRELVRRHIQMEAAGAPTVVHCSAGVGRTGTIIALDTLLQQMEKENAVDINGFVQKMRLNRPHMVQTESQYAFLHQCVLDSLQPNTTHEDEPIYENERDLVYANATALREYQNSMNKA